MLRLTQLPRAPRLPRNHFYPTHSAAERTRAVIYIAAILALVIWAIFRHG